MSAVILTNVESGFCWQFVLPKSFLVTFLTLLWSALLTSSGISDTARGIALANRVNIIPSFSSTCARHQHVHCILLQSSFLPKGCARDLGASSTASHISVFKPMQTLRPVTLENILPGESST
jgi:hypothetical protein